MNEDRDHYKHKGKKPKLSFDELLAKYLKENEVKRANRSNDVKSSRVPPKLPYAPHPTSFHPYSSWGWNDLWAHTPSYFRSYHVEYAASREPSCARQPYIENDRFEHKDQSRVQNKKKVAKQVYRVKRDGHKDTSSDLNTIHEKPINVLKTSAIDSKGKENSAVDIPNTKSEQKAIPKLAQFRFAGQSGQTVLVLPEGSWALGHSKGHGLVLVDSFVACALCLQLHMDCAPGFTGWTVGCQKCTWRMLTVVIWVLSELGDAAVISVGNLQFSQ
ncbi:hypothetical protein C2845_PM12G15920 [Panicum miliaceum]|uniref:Uncharacterized protein n=1 Tax=Panicum miliaceum TaxID=4540 RepID=A0A3L6QGZ8_PANMI|nr:hypothetical protein C2845_PM12G15920 [Panicum miliaceum]